MLTSLHARWSRQGGEFTDIDVEQVIVSFRQTPGEDLAACSPFATLSLHVEAENGWMQLKYDYNDLSKL